MSSSLIGVTIEKYKKHNFLKIGRYGGQKYRNSMMILKLPSLFRTKAHWKYLFAKNCFSGAKNEVPQISPKNLLF